MLKRPVSVNSSLTEILKSQLFLHVILYYSGNRILTYRLRQVVSILTWLFEFFFFSRFLATLKTSAFSHSSIMFGNSPSSQVFFWLSVKFKMANSRWLNDSMTYKVTSCQAQKCRCVWSQRKPGLGEGFHQSPSREPRGWREGGVYLQVRRFRIQN